jgi:hypothetical protein
MVTILFRTIISIVYSTRKFASWPEYHKNWKGNVVILNKHAEFDWKVTHLITYKDLESMNIWICGLFLCFIANPNDGTRLSRISESFPIALQNP